MKKLFAGLLAVLLTAALVLPALPASAADETAVQQTIQAMGVIVGDEKGNLDLSGSVTRAQFAKMMIAASTYKDSVSAASGSSPFKDVRYTHWAASYVQTAVNAGWLTGYTDGTFRPDKTVTLEEAASAVLRMLGYTASDFYGAYPAAQLAKFASLGLGENISKTQGQTLSRRDCMYLFYNLMGTKTASGSYYGTTLGYSVNTAGEVDYSSLILENMQGPFVLESGALTSALSFTPSAVYLNGASSSLSAAALYDVYYYNADMRTVWIYRNQVSGVYTAASPSTAAPSAVTVAGSAYTLASSSAAYALSDLGDYGIGDTVTLLLGRDGTVVGVIDPDEVSYTRYGVVVSTGTGSYTASGTTYTYATVRVASTDGSVGEYAYSGSADAGDLMKVSVSSGKVTVTGLSAKTLSGTVSAAGTKLGSYVFADDVQILDTTSNGSYAVTYPARLAGATLSDASVRYYVLDSSGKIEKLILNDVTGDLYENGIVTSIVRSEDLSNFGAQYKYLVNGVTKSVSSSKIFSGGEGPSQFEFDATGAIVAVKNLTQVTLTALNSAFGTAGTTQYPLGDGVAVYIRDGSSYYLSSVSAVSDTDSYTLTGCYDSALAGGRLRVILAVAK